MKEGRPDVDKPGTSTRGLRFPTQATGVEAPGITAQHGKEKIIPDKAHLGRPTVSDIAHAQPADRGPGNSSARLSNAFAPPPVRQAISLPEVSMPNPSEPARQVPSSPARASVKSSVSPGRSYAAIAAEQRAKKTSAIGDIICMGKGEAHPSPPDQHTMRNIEQNHEPDTLGVHSKGKDGSMGSVDHMAEDGAGRTRPRVGSDAPSPQNRLRPKGGIILCEDLGFKSDPGHDAMLAGVHAAEMSARPT
jgi:hypothetical protein